MNNDNTGMIVLIAIGLIGIGYNAILYSKAGIPLWQILLAFIPFIGPLIMWGRLLGEWPIEKELMELRRRCVINGATSSVPSKTYESRKWTSTKDGHEFSASYIRTEKDGIIVRRCSDNQHIKMMNDKLSPADIAYMQTLSSNPSQTAEATTLPQAN